jgi:hypothetical protein
MITSDGKRLMNSVLANRDVKLGTHIALGINVVSDASVDGASFPYTHNKYHSPYIVDEIPIANVGIIGGNPDQIVYSGQANVSKTFIANNVGLVARRFAGEVDEQITIVPVNSPKWNVPTTAITIPTDVLNFTEDGYLLLHKAVLSNNSRIYSDRVVLYGKALTDLIAFPFTIHGTSNPANIKITLRFTSHDLTGTVTVSELSRTVVNSPSGIGWRISGDTALNDVPTLTDPYNASRRIPFLWQGRIQNFTNATTLLANGDAITQVEILISAGTGDYKVACGSIKFTPDTISNFYRITTGYRHLQRTLYKTPQQAYVNAEYRILGV